MSEWLGYILPATVAVVYLIWGGIALRGRWRR